METVTEAVHDDVDAELALYGQCAKDYYRDDIESLVDHLLASLVAGHAQPLRTTWHGWPMSCSRDTYPRAPSPCWPTGSLRRSASG